MYVCVMCTYVHTYVRTYIILLQADIHRAIYVHIQAQVIFFQIRPDLNTYIDQMIT